MSGLSVWAMSFQFRAPAPLESGVYYWTNDYFFYGSGPAWSTAPNWNDLLDAVQMGTLDTTECVSIRATRLSDGFVSGIQTLAFFGLLPAEDGGLLTNAARMDVWSGEERRGYRLWRSPLRASDREGSSLSPGYVALLETDVIPRLLSSGMCLRDSGSISAITLKPGIHMWQLRHGTKRSDRVVYTYP